MTPTEPDYWLQRFAHAIENAASAPGDRSGGIPDERLNSLFSGDVQSSHGGLGLGLSISRTIIESHGGRIWAENNEEGGASFFFRVPRSS